MEAPKPKEIKFTNREILTHYVESDWQIEMHIMFESNDYSKLDEAVSFHLASAPPE